jgi:PilZ domain
MDLSQASHGGAQQLPIGERRSSQRLPHQRKALCQAQASDKNDPWLLGTSQDISLAGVGLILHRRFDPGTLVTIELERPKRDSWESLPARVIHATSQPDGNWKLGCALVTALSEEELFGWLNKVIR